MQAWEGEFPATTEYAHYYETYISKISRGNIIRILSTQSDEFLALIGSIPKNKSDFAYAPGKWTIKEVIGHIIETERVFAYRGLAFSRMDKNPLPSMEQDNYVRFASHGNKSLQHHADEYAAVRASTIHLFAHMPKHMLERKGIASGVEFTVRAIPFIIAGHQQHHTGILKTKYL